MAQFDVYNTQVSSILNWLKSDEIAIPEIQRPFVWKNNKVRDLLDSLYKGFPVGYLIMWKNPDVKLKDGSVSFGKKILIDGQQRITALQAAVNGEKVVKQNYKKDNITISFNPISESFEVKNVAIENDPKWINDLSQVFKDEFNQFQFINEYCKINNLIRKENEILLTVK